MGIVVNSTGNGYAYVDIPDPYDGQNVTLYAIADAGEELRDIYANAEAGYSIALDTTPIQSFEYNEAWGLMTIHVEFSGTTPPPPTPTISKLWLLMGLKKNNERRLKPHVRN